MSTDAPNPDSDEAPHPALQRLLRALDVVSTGPGLFEAGHPDPDSAHLFGGQVLAQAMMAAGRATGHQVAHSLHAYFLKRGSTSEPIRLEVRTLRKSRSFATHQVMASQSVGDILQMTLSYHRFEEGPVHQIPMDDVGPPSGEAYERSLLQVMTPGGEDDDLPFALPVEIKSVGEMGLFSTRVSPPQARCWMRVREKLPGDPLLHQALFAYASDYAIFTPALNPHPLPITDFLSASLDHALWFHAPLRMDEWMLFELDSPVARDGRGIARGLLYRQDGTLVGSCVQEGLLRPRKEMG